MHKEENPLLVVMKLDYYCLVISFVKRKATNFSK